MKKRGHSNDRDGRDILVRSRVRLRHANVAETAAASLPTLPYLTLCNHHVRFHPVALLCGQHPWILSVPALL